MNRREFLTGFLAAALPLPALPEPIESDNFQLVCARYARDRALKDMAAATNVYRKNQALTYLQWAMDRIEENTPRKIRYHPAAVCANCHQPFERSGATMTAFRRDGVYYCSPLHLELGGPSEA